MKFGIPGFGNIDIEYIVFDFNGTLAVDGLLLSGVKERLTALSNELEIYVLTADTFGKAKSQLEGIPCRLTVLPEENQDTGKLEFVKRLGCESSACVGNGRNDRLMLKESALGIAVILDEGIAPETLIAANVVFKDIVSALDMFKNPLRLTATLRS